MSTNISDNQHHDVYPAIDYKSTLKDSCKGKAVLITGGGRGIGKAIGLAFAYAGASTIVLTARSQGELNQARADILADAQLETTPAILTHVTDVVSEDSVRGLFERLAKEGVAIDILVNNAGYLEQNLLVHKGDPAEWWKTWEVNIKGTYLPTHFLLKQRFDAGALPTEASPITVICTSSVGAIRTRPGFSAYQPGKTAVNRFAEFLHAEYGDKGVRAFAYHPGGVMTKLAREGMPPETHGILVDKPELAAGFAVWLAGQRSADAFRGKYVSSNWDVDEMVKAAEERKGDAGWLTMKLVL